MTEQTKNNIRAFMARVNLTGAEVGEYIKCLQALEAVPVTVEPEVKEKK